MALAQIYSAIAGDTITAARWNNEFGNIYGNGTDVAFPLTKAVSFAGFTVTFDAAGVTTVTSPSNSGFLFTVGAKSGAPGANGSLATFTASTFTDTSTAAAGTAPLWTGFSIRQPTLAASALTVTTTKASSVYIEGAPVAGANETITNAYAVHVDSGKTQLDGDLQVDGATLLTGKTIAPLTDPYLLTNLSISATVGASALTIALKTDAGTDASAVDPIYIRFRNATLATSGTTKRSVTGALSLVISSGSTLGCVSAQAHRLYVGLLDNAGTPELFIYNPLSGSNLKGLVESQRISTTAEGGAGAADSAQVAYSTTARTNVAFRLIGFIECTQATAGTWATAPSTVQELQPWMPRTGQLVGQAIATNGVSSGNLTSTIPFDDTIPQVGEGTQVVSVNYTPQNSANIIEIHGKIAGITSGAGVGEETIVSSALFTSVSANALTATTVLHGNNNVGMRTTDTLYFSSAGLGAMTSAQIRIGQDVVSGAPSFRFNGTTTSSDFAATMNSYISVKEIMV